MSIALIGALFITGLLHTPHFTLGVLLGAVIMALGAGGR